MRSRSQPPRSVRAVVLAPLIALVGGCSALLGADFDRGGPFSDADASSPGTSSPGTTNPDASNPGSGDGGTVVQPDGAPGSPSGVCATGSTDCGKDGSTPRQCKDGQWLELSRCEGGTPVCVKGTCKASCNEGDVDCAGTTPRVCQGGNLVAKTPCAGDLPVCQNGACVACADGVTACAGATLTLCSGGTWVNDHACSGTTPECSKGACVGCTQNGACVSDRSRENCGANGAYVSGVVCTDPATVCSGSACTACPAGKVNCNDATDGCETTLDPTSGCAACQAPNKTCYQDADGDGYGSTVTRQVCGSCTTGWTATTGDCDDTDKDVHPGQVFIAPAPPRDLDFNCDKAYDRRLRSGATTLAFPAKVFVGCPGVGSGCFDSYSVATDLPVCGKTMTRCMDPTNGSDCIPDPSSPTYTVECR